MARPRHIAWILQAEYDVNCVKNLIQTGDFAQACFTAQQAAEKALKALAFFQGADLVKSYSLDTLTKDLKINGELERFAKILDLYYLTARYPDALPEHGVPSEKFDKSMATEALHMAGEFLNKVRVDLKV